MSCGLAEKSMNQFSAKLKREKIVCMKVKVEWTCPYFSVSVVFDIFIVSTRGLESARPNRNKPNSEI